MSRFLAASCSVTHASDPLRPPPVTDALARVRAATAARHERLDSALPVARAGAGMREYRAHLRLLRDWLLPMQAWERNFDDGPQDPHRLPRSERLRWLLDDLDELGECTRASTTASQWPARATPAWRWGVAYVVEGSQLGARVLLARLQPHLGEHRPRLLAGGGSERAGVRWRNFLQAFAISVEGDDATDDACEGAQHAFEQVARLAGLEAAAA